MSNLNAHIRKSHGMSWQEAERQTGISAKTGEMLVQADTEVKQVVIEQPIVHQTVIPATVGFQ